MEGEKNAVEEEEYAVSSDSESESEVEAAEDSEGEWCGEKPRTKADKDLPKKLQCMYWSKKRKKSNEAGWKERKAELHRAVVEAEEKVKHYWLLAGRLLRGKRKGAAEAKHRLKVWEEEELRRKHLLKGFELGMNYFKRVE